MSKGVNTNNICEYYHYYTVLSGPYVDFRTQVTDYSKNKTVITIRIDLVYEEYDLPIEKPFERFLYSKNSYFLYFKYFEAIKMNFTINNITQIPFLNVIIHEFEDSPRNTRRINFTNIPISFKRNNSQAITSFIYSTKSNLTKYITLQIKSSANISFFAKFDYPVTSIDLNDGIWKSIDNLISKEIYLFYVEVIQNEKINISLIINNTDYEHYEYELQNILDNRTIIQPYLKEDSIPNYLDI